MHLWVSSKIKNESFFYIYSNYKNTHLLILMAMKKRTIAFGFSFIIGLFTTCMMAQGQVYLFGQLISSASSAKFTEAIQVKTVSPISSFDLSTKGNNHLANTTLYNRTSRLILSSVSLNERSRLITASLTSGSLPEETNLKLSVCEPGENFKGYPGSISPEITLSKADVAVVQEIKTCTSGMETNDGYLIEYGCTIPAKQNAYTSLQGKKLTVTFTVSGDPSY